MSNIQFVEINPQKINNELINTFESSLDETLYLGDERRIFLDQQTQVIVGLKNDINETAKQNLLRYARGELLDALGEWWDTPRLQAKRSTTTFCFTLSDIQKYDILIPKGTRATPDGALYFSSNEDIIIKAGSISCEIKATAIEAGSKYNGFIPGQIKTLVDPIPFVKSVMNIDISQGGADIEPDDDGINIWSGYRERIRQAPRALSTAGPSGAYEYWAKTVDANINQAFANSPSPGVVQLVILMKNGELPSDEILDKVFKVCSDKRVRPLTDNLKVVKPNVVNYDISLTYYIDKNFAQYESSYRKIIEGDKLDCSSGSIRNYIDYHKNNLGKSVNCDELKYELQSSAAYTTLDNKVITVIRKVDFETPFNITIKDTEIAQNKTLKIVYGGLI